MKKGIAIFGKQYEHGYKNETHAPGSVVRVLFDEMIKLEADTAEYLYNTYTDLSHRYKQGSRLILESIASRLKSEDDAEYVDNVIQYCRKIAESCCADTDGFIYGGIEEDIIERTSYWCTDIARVACMLFQVAWFPSRIIVTANTNFAYCGHVVAEVYYDGKWCVTDPNAGIVFKHESGEPASAWDVHNDYEIANRIYRLKDPGRMQGNGIFFPPGEQFESVGIVNYYIDEMEKYSYETSGTNEFYKLILKNAGEKWADGLRWVHGEEFL
ncbi:MAG: transglutaminase-like domain-containing protein [Defluviitaleaceae bacterium]|nr:transglutaminase-like domain-containing protein [Defluviitaleaceae bacterium]